MANFFLERRKQLEKKYGKRISQHAMALKLQVTPNLIGYWERNEHAPRLAMAEKLAEVYEVPVERIEKAIIEIGRELRASASPA